MNLKEIYNNYKGKLDSLYMDYYHELFGVLDNDEDMHLSDDEQDTLTLDLMLSNVLGEITTFDEVTEALKQYKEKQL